MLNRMDRLFGTSISEGITVYLSTNPRCTYNIQGNYFFVYMNSPYPQGIIAHELLHFYTWHSFHDELTIAGVTKEKYNDIKESLTELLNMDFSDLLGSYTDSGYPQHQDARVKIRHMREEGKSIKQIVNTLATQ